MQTVFVTSDAKGRSRMPPGEGREPMGDGRENKREGGEREIEKERETERDALI